MAKTIIQSIGPLYGEPVNGTVFGRPNGSIFVPSVNTIKATIPDEYVGVSQISSRYYLIIANSSGVRAGTVSRVAESQDTANYMVWEFADNSDFTDATVFSSTAGIFNITDNTVGRVSASFTIVNGDTYYLRAALYASSGVPVAYSETFELTGVVNE